jgi:hypothetical protein
MYGSLRRQPVSCENQRTILAPGLVSSTPIIFVEAACPNAWPLSPPRCGAPTVHQAKAPAVTL